jgi:transketolase
VSYGALGTTHHSLHDFAALRAVNNLTIVAPADNFEAREAVKASARLASPVYLRFGKAPLYGLPAAERFELGSARVVRGGDDAAFIASGETVIHALLAAESLLESAGIDVRVISMPTIKPLDAAAVLDAASCRAVVTVEEHMVNGGLGEACAALLLQSGSSTNFKIVGIPDEYTVTGSQADIFRHYGISMEGLARTMLSLLSD